MEKMIEQKFKGVEQNYQDLEKRSFIFSKNLNKNEKISKMYYYKVLLNKRPKITSRKLN